MRRLPAALALIVVLATGCGKGDAPAASASAPAAATPQDQAPPPPSPPAVDEGAARTAALALGPGTCDEDVPAIQRYPMKGMLGVDPHFDRIKVHREAYKDCLLAMVRDATPRPDPTDFKGPVYAQGDLAYALLADLGYIQYGECVPAQVMADSRGKAAVHDWLATPNHRRQLLRCLGKQLGS
jgi:hypothetical protein